MIRLSGRAGRLLFALFFSSGQGEPERMCGLSRSDYRAAVDELSALCGEGTQSIEDACKLADEQADRKAQVAAIQRWWDERFPVEQYPYQRLQTEAAKGFLRLASNSAAEVYNRLRSVDGRERNFAYPKSYVEKVLRAGEETVLDPAADKAYWIDIMKQQGYYE